MTTSFDQWYRDTRARSNLTLRKLAPLIGCDQGQICHIEHGRRLPSPRHLAAFLNLVGASQEQRAEAWRLLAEADEARMQKAAAERR
jgi:transcriptional regulator with XRE-family HTH domain